MRASASHRPQFKKKFEWEAKKAVGLEDMVLVTKITDDAIVDNIKKRYNEDLIYVRARRTRARESYPRARARSPTLRPIPPGTALSDTSARAPSLCACAHKAIPCADRRVVACRPAMSIPPPPHPSLRVRVVPTAHFACFVRSHDAQTYIGPILIALNPYKNLPYYTQADVETYNGCVRHRVHGIHRRSVVGWRALTQSRTRSFGGAAAQIPHEVPPHIYALTDKMYRDMVSENENQCVIIRSDGEAWRSTGPAPAKVGLSNQRSVCLNVHAAARAVLARPCRPSTS